MGLGLTLGISSLLIGIGGLLINKIPSIGNLGGSTNNGELVTEEEILKNMENNSAGGVGGVGDVFTGNTYIPSKGQYGDKNDITAFPYTEKNPNFTGAKPLDNVGEWWLMANGKYFNKVSGEWQEYAPKIDNDNKNNNGDDDKKGIIGNIGASLGGIGSGLSGVMKALTTIGKGGWLLLAGGIALGTAVYSESKKKGKKRGRR